MRSRSNAASLGRQIFTSSIRDAPALDSLRIHNYAPVPSEKTLAHELGLHLTRRIPAFPVQEA